MTPTASAREQSPSEGDNGHSEDQPTAPDRGRVAETNAGEREDGQPVVGLRVADHVNTATVEGVDEDDDDCTVILLDHVIEDHEDQDRQAAIAWIDQTGPEMEERRRQVLLRELRRMQRTSFIHFALLCLIPTILLFVVLATVLGQNDSCTSEATFCRMEPRTFLNAFTSRCVCDAIHVRLPQQP